MNLGSLALLSALLGSGIAGWLAGEEELASTCGAAATLHVCTDPAARSPMRTAADDGSATSEVSTNRASARLLAPDTARYVHLRELLTSP
ncbi:MAG: hypothetical protein KIT16_08225 [Rhodospirillaceae bacterium]|nr:hypothetical protein [Rhodospirillaceae bacterium]